MVIAFGFSILAACDGAGLTAPSGSGGGAGGNVGGAGGGGTVAAGTYVVSWDAVNDPNVTGYKLYYANAPFTKTAPTAIAVGNVTSYPLDAGSLGLAVGSPLYVAVSAIGGGTESPLSDQVSVTVQ